MKNKPQVIAQTIDNLRKVFQVVNEQSKKAKRETGITGPQLWAIKMIAQSSPIRVSDLAEKMYIHPATVVGILNRLEEKDLVKRIRTKDDRRVVHVALTDLGKSMVRKSPEVAQGLLVAGLETLTVKELNSIYEGLGKLVEILGAQEIPPKLILSNEVNIPDELSQGKKKIRSNK
ncbi:MAG TPA: MarR family transcriptional regulator [Desulfomonilia bacterium]|nr:MarR family transcriptional regulator [Desulfomonilia bacterium]